MAYKRNQVIEAIRTALAGNPKSHHIDTRLKRLLHADRLLGRNPRAKSPEIARGRRREIDGEAGRSGHAEILARQARTYS